MEQENILLNIKQWLNTHSKLSARQNRSHETLANIGGRSPKTTKKK